MKIQTNFKHLLVVAVVTISAATALKIHVVSAASTRVSACVNKRDKAVVFTNSCGRGQSAVSWRTDGTGSTVSTCVNRETLVITWTSTKRCGSSFLLEWPVVGTSLTRMSVCVDSSSKRVKYAPMDWCPRRTTKRSWIRTTAPVTTTTSSTTAPTGPYLGTQFGGASDEGILSAATDSSGGVVVAGYDCSTISDIPVIGGGSNENCNVFVASFGPTGSAEWVRNFGGPTGGSGGYVASDGAGGFILGWSTSDSVYATADGTDLVISHLTSAGDNDWNWQSGIAGQERIAALTVASDGAIITTGNAGNDFFLTKVHRASGSMVVDWTLVHGSTQLDTVYSVVVRADGSIVTMGDTAGSMPDSGAGVPASKDVFVVAFSSGGSRVWTRQIHESEYLGAGAMSADSAGNLVIATLSFNEPGYAQGGFQTSRVGVYSLSGSNGSTTWSTLVGSHGGDSPYGVSIDATGNIFVVGHSTGVVGGGGSSNTRQPFAIKLTSAGKQVWARQTESANGNGAYVWGSALTSSGNLLMYGEALNDMGGLNAAPGAGFDDAWFVTISSAGEWPAKHN